MKILTKNVCELVDFYGDVAATYDYAPFGAVTAGTPSGSAVPANPFQWPSEVYDAELGLVYYNYRHYSPNDGRFLSRDPIEEQGGLNLYAFVGNNAIRRNDILGESWELKKITILKKELHKISFSITGGGISGDLLSSGAALWKVEAKLLCECGEEKKDTKSRGLHRCRQRFSYHLEKLVPDTPSLATSLPGALFALLSAEMKEQLSVYFVEAASQREYERFLKKLQRLPHPIPNQIWGKNPCE